jgi:hypothetical protein
MLLAFDLKRRIRKFDGPFDAKMFDGDYLKTQKIWIKNKLDGIGYAADHHYCWKKICWKCFLSCCHGFIRE